MTRPILSVPIVIGIALCPAFGQTPGWLSFQGLLKDNEGAPVTGPVDLEFRIWDAPADGNGDGTVVWGPHVVADVPVTNGLFSSVPVTNGLFSSKFGSVPASAFDGTPR